MSSSNDSIGKTLTVALSLCLVCSVLVSGAAVMLKPTQIENKALDKKTNILAAAGIETAGQDVNALFEQFEVRVVDLETGRYTDDVDPSSYDQSKAAKDSALSKALTKAEDLAGINRQERYAVVYLIKNGSQLDKVIVPVRGYGLWSTLHGFMALEGDANTVVGLGFYQHGETPGLGGEVDNPLWKASWVGKRVYNAGRCCSHWPGERCRRSCRAGWRTPHRRFVGCHFDQ